MIRETAPREPVLPVMGRPHEALVCLVEGSRRLAAFPRQGDEARLALLDQGPPDRLLPFEAEVDVARQRELDLGAFRSADPLPIAGVRVLPATRRPAVVEDRLAVERELHLAVHAADGPQQDVLGVVVRRRTPMRSRPLLVVTPWPEKEDVADDHPALR